jgi:hypothetical protein
MYIPSNLSWMMIATLMHLSARNVAFAWAPRFAARTRLVAPSIQTARWMSGDEVAEKTDDEKADREARK